MKLSYFEDSERIVGATAVKSDHHIQIAPRITATNRGKTPATDTFITHTGKITNHKIKDSKAPNRHLLREVFDFHGYRVGPHYLGLDETKPFDLSLDIVFDRGKQAAFTEACLDGTAEGIINSLTNMSFMNAYFAFQITLSFADQFSEQRRAFHVSYLGKIDENWVTLAGSRELLTHEQDYIQHQKEFDAFIKGSKPKVS